MEITDENIDSFISNLIINRNFVSFSYGENEKRFGRVIGNLQHSEKTTNPLLMIETNGFQKVSKHLSQLDVYEDKVPS